MQFMYLEEQSRTVELWSYLSSLLFERKICILRSECTFIFLWGKDKGTFIFSQSAFSHWKVSVAMYSLKCRLSATIFILKTFGKTYKQLTSSSSLFLNIFVLQYYFIITTTRLSDEVYDVSSFKNSSAISRNSAENVSLWAMD